MQFSNMKVNIVLKLYNFCYKIEYQPSARFLCMTINIQAVTDQAICIKAICFICRLLIRKIRKTSIGHFGKFIGTVIFPCSLPLTTSNKKHTPILMSLKTLTNDVF